MKKSSIEINKHPIDKYLRRDRMPHIWCPGCGLGMDITAFIEGTKQANIDMNNMQIVSGIGCTGRISGYIKLDAYHTTHGRAIPFASGLKLANRNLTVVVFSGDGDLFAIGGNHLIHAARRNVDLTVICVNNFIYGMTGGQTAPTTPVGAFSSTAPYGNFEKPFNLVGVAASAGASYVARWTSLHTKRLANSIAKALSNKGFSFIEIVSPCPTVFGRKNNRSDALGLINELRDRSRIDNSANPTEIPITNYGEIVIGDFLNEPRPCFSESFEEGIKKTKERIEK
jgi:2-oxoglutarate ferredoxin oxidoreductase subunit beta